MLLCPLLAYFMNVHDAQQLVAVEPNPFVIIACSLLVVVSAGAPFISSRIMVKNLIFSAFLVAFTAFSVASGVPGHMKALNYPYIVSHAKVCPNFVDFTMKRLKSDQIGRNMTLQTVVSSLSELNGFYFDQGSRPRYDSAFAVGDFGFVGAVRRILFSFVNSRLFAATMLH